MVESVKVGFVGLGQVGWDGSDDRELDDEDPVVGCFVVEQEETSPSDKGDDTGQRPVTGSEF